MKRTGDLVVKVGSFTDKEGKTKNKYLNVGSRMTNDDGGVFFLINRTFNPAGVPNPDGRDSVLVSVFEIKTEEKKQSPADIPEPDWSN